VHKGGNLIFGPDGFLYFAIGDGGAANTPEFNAQHPQSILGKMVRIDVDVPASHSKGYVIPPDNPFVDRQPIAALGEIWAFGYHNPWRFSFDDFGPGATNALIVGDVGLETREEIDYEPAGSGGRNYGWYIREGLVGTPGVPQTTPIPVPAPAGLNAQVGPAGAVSLTWAPTAEATSYLIEAGTASGASNIGVIPVSATTVSGVVGPGMYFARVRAVSTCGQSAVSNEVMIQVP